MFEPLHDLVAKAEADAAASAEAGRRTMAEVEALLDREIADGKSTGSRKRAASALRSLLKTQNLTPQSADLDLEWFDLNFPLDGWNPVSMPTLTQESYRDYRKRVRAAIERVLGIAQKRQAARAVDDGWSSLGMWLKTCPEFQNLGSRRLIPIVNTLTIGARLCGYQPEAIRQNIIQSLHDAAVDSGTRSSYRSASALICKLQTDPDRAEIWSWVSHAIRPIQSKVNRTHDLPDHFLAEIEAMTEIATQLRYVEVKEIWEYVADKTRDNYRTTLRALVGALMVTGTLSSDANSVRPALENSASLATALRCWLGWLKSGTWAESTTIKNTGRLPCILERNGIDVADLKRLIKEVAEFQDSHQKQEMNEQTKAFCRALIERTDFRSDFLLSHMPPRRSAETILKRARVQNRNLKPSEAVQVRQLGTVALFNAIECGGAPIRVSNFLMMTSIGDDAWLKCVSKDRFELTVPAGYTKNKKKIWAPINASREKYHDTVRWYLQHVRPLFLMDSLTGVSMVSPYLVPAVTDHARPLPYDTFRSWFLRIMRDDVGIPCTPHNFRHGQASLLYHANPGLLRTIARRLGDTEQTVVESYAWVHEELEAERGQDAVVAMIRKPWRK